jgi:hypothetical protein
VSALLPVLRPVRRLAARIAPYLDVWTLVLGGAAVILAAAHSADFPHESDWTDGHVLPIIQIVAIVLWVVSQIAQAVQGRRSRRNVKLEDACRDVAAFIDESCPRLPLSHVGVHIWEVPMLRGNLRRSASFLLIGNRARSGIHWTKGKGVVGYAWEHKVALTKDLEEVRSRAKSPEQFAALPEDDRLGLSWDEFRSTPRYRAVYARPLYSREGRGVKGVIAIDLLKNGHFTELESATDSLAFEGVIGVCESALRKREN